MEKGLKFFECSCMNGEHSFGCERKYKIKLMQLRVPAEVYEKIRERAYVERRSMQSIVMELLEKEFLADKAV